MQSPLHALGPLKVKLDDSALSYLPFSPQDEASKGRSGERVIVNHSETQPRIFAKCLLGVFPLKLFTLKSLSGLASGQNTERNYLSD